jgi:hypothetical protein
MFIDKGSTVRLRWFRSLKILLSHLRSGFGVVSVLQQQRLADVAGFQSRDFLSISVSWVLFVLIASYLAVIGWQREHTAAYLATKKRIVTLDAQSRQWQVSHARRDTCDDLDSCYELLKARPLSTVSFSELTDREKSPDRTHHGPSLILVRSIMTVSDGALENRQYLIVGFPSASYDKAVSFINGRKVGTHFLDQRIGIPFYRPDAMTRDLVVDVLYETDGSGQGLFIAGDEEPLLITTVSEYRAWVRMLIMQDARQGNWISDMSLIVMAALFLMIFLFVDRSPEVLGLALFMGFDAISRSLDYGWLPMTDHYPATVFLENAAQIMRIYYIVQICRLGSPRPKTWVLGALIFGAMIGCGPWLRTHGISFTDDISDVISMTFNLFFSLIGFFVMQVTAFHLRGKGLYWRQWALLVASVALLLQGFSGLDVLLPSLQSSQIYYQVRSVTSPLASYLLAASAFINISTLENRVRSMSQLVAKNEEIERELDLGRVVQRAFMKIPELPPVFDAAFHYEPAFYVSGDAYFLHWDEKRSKLVVILGDMTGHGVQAALKSTTMHTLARSVFMMQAVEGVSADHSGDHSGDILNRYGEALIQTFQQTWGQEEIPAYVGAEIDARSGQTAWIRSNFPWPLLVRKNEGGDWRVLLLSDSAERSFRLGVGEFLVFASDGIFDGSRRVSAIKRQIEASLRGRSKCDAESIKSVILNTFAQKSPFENDDKSIVVIGRKLSVVVGGDAPKVA